MKLLLVDIKANSSILMRLEMTRMAQNKQKCLIFIEVPRVRVENQISSNFQVLPFPLCSDSDKSITIKVLVTVCCYCKSSWTSLFECCCCHLKVLVVCTRFGNIWESCRATDLLETYKSENWLCKASLFSAPLLWLNID